MPTTSRTPSVATGKPIATVTPTGLLSTGGTNQRMTVEKGIVDELLLVCGVIGSTATDPSNEDQLIPVTDCLNWLQDLQRALRRDDDTYRPISLLIGNWKVVQQKLLPLVMNCRYDTPLVLTIVKILVILTKPLSENAKRAGRMVIDTKNRKLPQSVIKEQIKLRENALAQSDMLMEYKRAIAHHPSHLASRKTQEKKEGGILSVFVSLLAEPLSKTGTARTDSDHLTIELVLHLFRNLLSAEPILKNSSEVSRRSVGLHQELLVLFERELVLDIVLVIAQEMELRENEKYNLLMMELLHHLIRNQDPTAVARSVETEGLSKRQPGKENFEGPIQATAKPSSRPQISDRSVPKSSGSLRSQLEREKQKLNKIATTRHSHFGGTLTLKRKDGKRQYRSAVLGDKRAAPPAAKKRKNRKTDPFIGAGRTFASHTRGNVSIGEDGPAAVLAQRSLSNFCTRFVKDCYGPVMKSLKNEFRRDSVRLEEGDKVVFFRIVWFFCQWWRVSGAGRQSAKDQSAQKEGTVDDPSNALGHIIFTMDVFTFNLVLNATDSFLQQKKHSQLAQTVALYSEMMHMLLAMYRSQDSTENLMALGLLNRLFYGNEQLDRLPKLLSKWTPGTSTRDYLCDLVELCHVTLKLLELNAKACLEDQDKIPETDKKKRDTVARMKAVAADFDLSSYISRKIVSNHLVFMYTHLLSQYLINAPHVNHHLVAFFLRLCKMNIVVSEESEVEVDAEATRNLLASKTVSLEPMLYHIQMLTVLNQILNDSTIRNDKEYETLLSFAATIMGNFAKAAKANPMLHVECLFRHPLPHRFCELSTNMYVTEELRMIAERELLLDERRRLESEEHDQDEGSIGGDEGERGDGDRSKGGLKAMHTSATEEDDAEAEWVDMDSTANEDTSKRIPAEPVAKDDNAVGEEKGSEQQSDDSDDEKWNDRRAFVPRSKRVSANRHAEEEDSIHDGTQSVSEASKTEELADDKNHGDDKVTSETKAVVEATKKHRIRKREISLDEDDDIFETDETQPATGSSSSRKFVFDDDD